MIHRLSGLAGILAVVTTPTTAQIGSLSEPDRVALEPLVREARIVTFGESAHRLERAHIFAAELLRYLVEEHGVRVLFLEAAWQLDAHVMPVVDSTGDLDDPALGFYLNAFDSPHTRAILAYVRDHNRQNTRDRVYVAGMQPENPVSDVQLITQFFEGRETPADVGQALRRLKETFSPYASDVEFVAGAANGFREGRDLLGEERRQQLLRDLEHIRDHLDEYTGDHAFLARTRLGVLSLQTYLEALYVFARAYIPIAVDPPDDDAAATARLEALRRSAYGQGDATRAEVVSTLLTTQYRGLRAMTWLHNWHAARRSEIIALDHPATPPLGTVSFGTHLDALFEDQQVIIGSVSAPPETTPQPDGTPTIGQTVLRIVGPDRRIFDLANPPAETRSLFTTPGRIVAEPGLGMTIMDIVLQRHFDAIVFFPGSEYVKR